jgi:uncharacterized protein (UPF0335 family)
MKKNKKIDLVAILLVVIGIWLFFRDTDKSTGQGGGGTQSGSQSGTQGHQKKIQENSQSVLKNLDDQLDTFAEELAEEIQGVDRLDPNIKGFENGVPEAYAPKKTTAFSSKEKLMDDLGYRLNKFGHDAQEEQREFAKTHHVAGADMQAYTNLVNKHKAQKKQIMDRHKEILIEYVKETQPKTDLR